MFEERHIDHMFNKQITDIMMSIILTASQRCLRKMQINCAENYRQEKQNFLSVVCR